MTIIFTHYLKAVNGCLEKMYGITTDDCGLRLVVLAWEVGETPAACARCIGEKYDLYERE